MSSLSRCDALLASSLPLLEVPLARLEPESTLCNELRSEEADDDDETGDECGELERMMLEAEEVGEEPANLLPNDDVKLTKLGSDERCGIVNGTGALTPEPDELDGEVVLEVAAAAAAAPTVEGAPPENTP